MQSAAANLTQVVNGQTRQVTLMKQGSGCQLQAHFPLGTSPADMAFDTIWGQSGDSFTYNVSGSIVTRDVWNRYGNGNSARMSTYINLPV